MKNLLKITFLLASALIFAQTSLKATYLHGTFLKTSKESKEKTEKEMKKVEGYEKKYSDFAYSMFDKLGKENQVFTLLVKDSLSTFILQEKLEMNIMEKMGYAFAKLKGNWFNNVNKQTRNNLKFFQEKAFLVEYSAKDVEWEITNESRKIGDYECYKAIYNKKGVFKKIETRPVEVWFAPSIPVSAGPFELSGLPGLVIYATDNKTWKIVLDTLEMNPKEIKLSEPNKNAEKISLQKMLEKENDFYN